MEIMHLILRFSKSWKRCCSSTFNICPTIREAAPWLRMVPEAVRLLKCKLEEIQEQATRELAVGYVASQQPV
jgi:hypothetical protein